MLKTSIRKSEKLAQFTEHFKVVLTPKELVKFTASDSMSG